MSEDKLLYMNDSDICSGPDVTDLFAYMSDRSLELSLRNGDDAVSFNMSPHDAAFLRDFLNEFLSQQ